MNRDNPKDLLVAQTFTPAPFGVVPRGVVVSQPHNSDAMEGSIRLAVAATIESMPTRVTRTGWQRAHSKERGE
jgi:hypothetical protein